MRQRIEVEIPHEDRIPFVSPTLYEFKPKQGWVRLQRFLFWLLGKIGARHTFMVTSHKRVVVNRESFEKAIWSQISYIHDYMNVRPTTVLMGPEDFTRLANSDKPVLTLTTFNFNVDIEVRKVNPMGYGRKVFGLKCYVVPWMSGILVLPPVDYLRENF